MQPSNAGTSAAELSARHHAHRSHVGQVAVPNQGRGSASRRRQPSLDRTSVFPAADLACVVRRPCPDCSRSEEHTSELQSLMRISYAVFCLKKKRKRHKTTDNQKY